MDKIDETLASLRAMFERNHRQVAEMNKAFAGLPPGDVTAADVRDLVTVVAGEQETMLRALALLTRCVMDIRGTMPQALVEPPPQVTVN